MCDFPYTKKEEDFLQRHGYIVHGEEARYSSPGGFYSQRITKKGDHQYEFYVRKAWPTLEKGQYTQKENTYYFYSWEELYLTVSLS